jgi:putative protein kinase ArgK-like GTPase of G3E family
MTNTSDVDIASEILNQNRSNSNKNNNKIAENQEQLSARNRIRTKDRIPITGRPGTGKSTVISLSCFDKRIFPSSQNLSQNR